MRSAIFAASLLTLSHGSAGAQMLSLCPPTVVNTCYVGYVTARDRMIVLLSSAVQDPLINHEARVTMQPQTAVPGVGLLQEDLSKQIGRVVMLDAVGGHAIDDARLESVA